MTHTNNTMQLQTKQLAGLGLLLAVGLILSYIESLIPFNFGIPGVKLGLSNLMVILILYMYGAGYAILVNFMRILLSGFMFGNMFGILYSLAGAFVSFLFMFIFKKFLHFDAIYVSIIGGIFHNIGQLLLATILISEFSFFYYLPFLFVSGIGAGFIVGILSKQVLHRISAIHLLE